MEIGRLQQFLCAYWYHGWFSLGQGLESDELPKWACSNNSNYVEQRWQTWTNYSSLLKLSSLSYSLVLIWLIWLEIGSLNDDTMIQHGSNYFCRSIVNPNQKAAGEHWAVRVSCRAAEQFKTEVPRNGGRLCQPYDKARVVHCAILEVKSDSYAIHHMYTVIHIQIQFLILIDLFFLKLIYLMLLCKVQNVFWCWSWQAMYSVQINMYIHFLYIYSCVDQIHKCWSVLTRIRAVAWNSVRS